MGMKKWGSAKGDPQKADGLFNIGAQGLVGQSSYCEKGEYGIFVADMPSGS
jgi:hypothetical protein